jgi:hypothetical protein
VKAPRRRKPLVEDEVTPTLGRRQGPGRPKKAAINAATGAVAMMNDQQHPANVSVDSVDDSTAPQRRSARQQQRQGSGLTPKMDNINLERSPASPLSLSTPNSLLNGGWTPYRGTPFRMNNTLTNIGRTGLTPSEHDSFFAELDYLQSPSRNNAMIMNSSGIAHGELMPANGSAMFEEGPFSPTLQFMLSPGFMSTGEHGTPGLGLFSSGKKLRRASFAQSPIAFGNIVASALTAHNGAEDVENGIYASGNKLRRKEHHLHEVRRNLMSAGGHGQDDSFTGMHPSELPPRSAQKGQAAPRKLHHRHEEHGEGDVDENIERLSTHPSSSSHHHGSIHHHANMLMMMQSPIRGNIVVPSHDEHDLSQIVSYGDDGEALSPQCEEMLSLLRSNMTTPGTGYRGDSKNNSTNRQNALQQLMMSPSGLHGSKQNLGSFTPFHSSAVSSSSTVPSSSGAQPMNMSAIMNDPRMKHGPASTATSAMKRKYQSVDPDQAMIQGDDDEEDQEEQEEDDNDENQDTSNMQLNSSSLSTSLLHTFQANVNVKTPARHNHSSILRYAKIFLSFHFVPKTYFFLSGYTDNDSQLLSGQSGKSSRSARRYAYPHANDSSLLQSHSKRMMSSYNHGQNAEDMTSYMDESSTFSPQSQQHHMKVPNSALSKRQKTMNAEEFTAHSSMALYNVSNHSFEVFPICSHTSFFVFE